VAKAKLLIVDDEEAIREVISTLLEALGYDCSSVSNGRLAKEYLQAHEADVVLSDMIMPEMDGIRLLEWMRTHLCAADRDALEAFIRDELSAFMGGSGSEPIDATPVLEAPVQSA